MSGDEPQRAPKPVVAIIGGGCTGGVIAHQLARREPGALRIVVVEPRERLGAGLAYSTLDPAHRINVPAKRMSFVPSDPCHFDRWLKADSALHDDPAAVTPDGRAFPARAVFGRYAAATLEPYLLSGAIEHIVAKVASVTPDGDRYALTLADGATLAADAVVLAATHPQPAAPRGLEELAGDARLVVDAQRGGALDGVAHDARVLIVGTGLTMADIVASLDARGHRGPIVAVSRRGLLSRGHAAAAGDVGDFLDPPARSASEVVRRIRRTVAAAAAEGLPWQVVLDAVRTQAPGIWANLPRPERLRVVRRLRPFWDVHRFRVAPQVEAAITRRRADGTLQLIVGTPIAAEARPDRLDVTIRRRDGDETRAAFDAVVLATGPAHTSMTETDPLISSLAREGLVRADDVGLGLATDDRGRAIGADGAAQASFWIGGPLARGAFGELMGLPEVTRYAEFVAGDVLRRFEDYLGELFVRRVA